MWAARRFLAQRLNLPIIGATPSRSLLDRPTPAQSQALWLCHADVFTPTRWLVDGDTVTVGKVTLNVRHTYTPGHVVFHSPEAQRAFVGDVPICWLYRAHRFSHKVPRYLDRQHQRTPLKPMGQRYHFHSSTEILKQLRS